MFLPTPLPIHIEYFTAYVSDDEAVSVLRNDVYGYEHKIEEALGLFAGCGEPERRRAIRPCRDIDDKASNQRFSLN